MEIRLHHAQVALFATLGCFIDLLECFVTLSSFEATQVCSGQQLELRCATNETALVWSFVPRLINDQGAPIQQDWFITSEDLSQQSQTLTVNSTSFTFLRISTQHASPLVSMLTIINSSSALNTKILRCTKIVNNQHAMAALTTILVIEDTHTGSLSPPEVNSRPMFEMNDVSVTLEWIPEDGVVYNVAADQTVTFRFIKRRVVNLTVAYNTPTNVTITATSCGQKSNSQTAISSVELAYGRCDDPLLSITDDSVMAMGYDNIALNGTVVTFSCSPGQMLNGPNSVTCTHTGQWEPNPSAVNCSEFEDVTTSSEKEPVLHTGTPQCRIPSSSPDSYIIPYNSTDDRIRVTFACQGDCGGELKSYLELHTAVCTSNGILEINPLNTSENLLTVVVASLVTVILVSIVIIFIVGFLCGQRFGHRVSRGTLNQASGTNPPKGPQVLTYESVVLNPTHEEQPIELEENVAYGPSTANVP